VLDQRGQVLFEHDFGFPVRTTEPRSTEGLQPPAQIADIDGDGRREVLLAVPASAREDRRLYCFEADGRLRFVHQPRGSRRYGDVEYAEPWLAHRVFVTVDRDGRPTVWGVFTHGAWFPTRVQELSPTGVVRAEYHSAGFVEVVKEAVWRGRRVVLVGSADNAHRGAALAVLDRDAVRGSSPATRRDYACADCPTGRPLEYAVFPSSCLLRSQGGMAAVVDAWVEGGDRLNVLLLQGRGSSTDLSSAGGVTSFYSLGPDLAPVHVEISREFQSLHAAWEKRGLVDHAFGATDDAQAFPVRRFDGAAFVERPAVRVVH
jgi:hypothetical protein